MKKRNLISVTMIGLMLISCTDFLSVNPQSELTQEAFPKSASDALLATNAAYTTLRNWHYHAGGFPILDIMSDDSHKGSNPNDAASTIGPYDDFSFSTTADGLDRWWTTLYQGIRYSNVVIEKIPDIAMDNMVKERYIAEAKFLRGLYYFDLVRAFGGVPLITSTEPDLRATRSSAEDVFALVISDLESAIDVLPEKDEYGSADLGRATKGAAQALLARVYLFRGDFTNTERYAMDVVNSGLYGLEPVFTDANGENGEHGIESVFEIGAVSVATNVGNQYANTQGVRGNPNRGWGFNRPSIDLREAFVDGDPRRSGTIIELGDVIDGIEILGDSSTPDELTDAQGNVLEIESYNRKVWITGLTTTTQYGHNRRLIRYADVLLMAAEALNENNKSAQALPLLNQVRERARQGNNNILPNITETNKDALRDIIHNERRVELALEGHRFWDLVRTGKAEQVLGPLGFVPGKHELLPIPQSEIDLSQGTITQNPNW